MDTKRLIIAFVVAAVLLVTWNVGINWLYTYNNWQRPHERAQQAATTAPATQTAAATTDDGTSALPSTVAASTQPDAAPAVDRLQVNATTTPLAARIGADEYTAATPYRQLLTISPNGAGLDAAVLTEFKSAVKKEGHYVFQRPYNGPAGRALATTAIVVDGKSYDIGDKPWTYDEQQSNDTLAVYNIELTDDGAPVVRITKRYEVRPASHEGLGYETLVTQQVTNLSDHPITVSTAMNGVLPPVRELEQHDDRQIIAGYYDARKFVSVHPHGVPTFKKDRVTQDLTKDPEQRAITWFGASSAYFNAIVHPVDSKQIAQVEAIALNPDATDAGLLEIATTMKTTETSIDAGATSRLDLQVYLGPKLREVLLNSYYSALPRAYGETLGTMTSGCGTYCTFSWLINGLVTFLGIFHAVTRDWGLAIICLVIVVRIILHPITKKSTVSMHKMTRMAPEIERLKKKYGDNKEELNKAMIDVYKQQGATPILGCLPMLLQTPIWIALWTALSSTFELRGAPFLWGMTWIHDLSAPDRLVTFTNPIPLLFGFKLASINLLPIVLGFVFYLQQKYMPQAPAMTPEQQQQKKMMLWMTVLIFPLFLYGQPSGLTLYILTSTAIGILEQKRIRAHIKEQEEKEKSAIEVVDAGQTRGGKFAARDRKPNAAPAATAKTGFGGFVARMQARVEELQRQQQQQQKSKKRK